VLRMRWSRVCRKSSKDGIFGRAETAEPKRGIGGGGRLGEAENPFITSGRQMVYERRKGAGCEKSTSGLVHTQWRGPLMQHRSLHGFRAGSNLDRTKWGDDPNKLGPTILG